VVVAKADCSNRRWLPFEVRESGGPLRGRPGITVARIGKEGIDMEEHCWASQQWHPEFCHTYLGTDPKRQSPESFKRVSLEESSCRGGRRSASRLRSSSSLQRSTT